MKPIILILSCLTFRQVAAQKFVGDTLPDAYLGQQLFHSNNKLKLSRYREPIVILNVMGINCRYCIAALAKYDTLLPQFEGKVKMLLLLKGTRHQNEAFLLKHNLAKFKNLSFIALDPALQKQFNLIANPFHVWLNRQREIVAITNEEYINAGNFQKLLQQEEPPAWPDISLPAQPPLIAADGINNIQSKTFYSLLEPYRPGFDQAHFLKFDTVKQWQHYKVFNRSVYQLYVNAISPLKRMDIAPGRILFQVKNAEGFRLQPAGLTLAEWKRKQFYCYETLLPLFTTQEERHRRMLEDINMYLGVRGEFQTRPAECWVLRKKEGTVNFRSADGVSGRSTLGGTVITLNNARTGELFITDDPGVKFLHHHRSDKFYMKDIAELQQEFEQNGLELVKQIRELVFYVITDQ